MAIDDNRSNPNQWDRYTDGVLEAHRELQRQQREYAEETVRQLKKTCDQPVTVTRIEQTGAQLRATFWDAWRNGFMCGTNVMNLVWLLVMLAVWFFSR